MGDKMIQSSTLYVGEEIHMLFKLKVLQYSIISTCQRMSVLVNIDITNNNEFFSEGAEMG